jgi:2-oxoglutarate dehydrogenase E2 component (dihydrolipoamide succinyltransferase)
VEIVMPALGITVAEGTLVRWHKRPGDWVSADEAICEISSDKIDSDLPAPEPGQLRELLVDVGETVEVGTVIATLAVAAARDEDDGAPAVAVAQDGDGGAPGSSAASGSSRERERRHSPVVVRLAAELGVSLENISGSGRDGRIRREDVIAAAGVASSAPSALYVPPPAGELSRMRRSIGEHMKRSLNSAATVTSWIEVDFDAVESRRRELGTTALPIVAAATAATLAQFGELNAWLDGDRHTLHRDVNLGIAVSLGADGLVVPVVRAAQRLDVPELAAAIAELVTRARAAQLTPDDVRDGTFTITNPGQFGTIMATPVINQPQVAILDVEAIVRRPVAIVIDDAEIVAIRSVCVLGLSWDHRALDGAYAARFLAALRERLEALD